MIVHREVQMALGPQSRHVAARSHVKTCLLWCAGGKREPMDPTPEATAQRELREESAG